MYAYNGYIHTNNMANFDKNDVRNAQNGYFCFQNVKILRKQYGIRK